MEEIIAFCRRNPIEKLSLFGSVLRDDFGENSDVDFLVELAPNSGVGLFKFMNMQFELEDMLGRKVDLRTPQDLHERFRDAVVKEAESLYVREK
jgi:predicted nucleotidyltransferase